MEPMRASWIRPAVAGAVTVAGGIATSMLATGMLNERANPVVAVAEAVIKLTPGPVAETLIGLVGHWDKPLLIAGVSFALLALGAVAALLHRRKPFYATAVFLVLGSVGAAAEMTQVDAGPLAVVPVVVGVLTWMLVLPLLMGPAPAPETLGRRVFLQRVAFVGGMALLMGFGGRALGGARRVVEQARSALKLPVTAGTVPTGADIAPTGVATFRTPNDEFYRVDTALVPPSLDPNTWSLRIHGMVEKEITVTYADLLARPISEDWVTLCCVSNPVGGDLIGNAWWSGVRIADLLAEAKPLPGADAVLQTSHDGWNCGTPLEALTDDRNAILALAMNGEPLPVEHGFPVRSVVPGLFGYVSATKWVVDMEVTRFSDFTAYWTKRGWSAKGPVKTESRIDVPRQGRSVAAGEVPIGGVAWAQHTGIAKVEVRLDGGDWQQMELGETMNNDSWVQWAGRLTVTRGIHRLAVRATDKSGYTQTPVVTQVVPDGASGWHTINFAAN
jgi:DMSO/TMAO reductase YedYZ molybdopterin-dependent catalytic subunit